MEKSRGTAMNEQEWMACTDAGKMFDCFGGLWGDFRLDRRLRRFAVACCRRVRRLVTEDIFLAAADAGEAFTDDPRNTKGTIPVMARASIEGWRHLRRYENSADRHQFHAARAAVATCASTDWHAGFHSMQQAALALNQADVDCFDPAELRYQATLLRCLFGPLLFRPTTLALSWLTGHDGLLVSMAQQMYEGGDLSAMPMLADALEEAGCTNPDILNHCRSGGEHVRGCWVVDLVLGKR